MRLRLVKLVRDRIGDRLGDDTVVYQPIESEHAALTALRGKLVEEALEYLLDPSMSELADVWEVILGLLNSDPALDGDIDDLFDEADRKRRERGGFDDLIGMHVRVREGL